MKNIKLFEGFNDNSDEICLPLGITKSQFAAIAIEKGKSEDEIDSLIEEFLEIFQSHLDLIDLNATDEAVKFLEE